MLAQRGLLNALLATVDDSTPAPQSLLGEVISVSRRNHIGSRLYSCVGLFLHLNIYLARGFGYLAGRVCMWCCTLPAAIPIPSHVPMCIALYIARVLHVQLRAMLDPYPPTFSRVQHHTYRPNIRNPGTRPALDG